MNNERAITSILGDVSATRMPGGISNENYRITPNNGGSERFLTLFPESEDFWKIGKDLRVTGILNKIHVPTPEIIDHGIKTVEQNLIGYLVKEFIDGKDFDEVMRDSQNLSDYDWEALLSQLGVSLSTIHSLSLEQFGLIKSNFISGSEHVDIPASLNWKEFISTMLSDKEKAIQSIGDNLKCGDVSGSDIKRIFNDAKTFYLSNAESLDKVRTPFLTHNDMRMGNVMAKQVGGVWQLASVIDHEWVLAGDPDIDLIQIENWLQFAPYKDKFIRHKKSFLEAYSQSRIISSGLGRKRRLYNMLRSISYLVVVFNLRDFQGFISDSQNVLNVQKHFNLLKNAIDLSKNIEEIF